MSPTTALNFVDRFGRAYTPGATIVYPTRRGSHMELVEATVIITGEIEGYDGPIPVINARRKSGVEVTIRNLWDVVVIPTL